MSAEHLCGKYIYIYIYIYIYVRYCVHICWPPMAGGAYITYYLLYIYMYIYTHIYIYIYIGGWGAETNREIVSFRSCVRTQLYVRSEWIAKMIAHPCSLFSFHLEIPFLLPCEIRCSLSLEINDIKGIHVRSSESK